MTFHRKARRAVAALVMIALAGWAATPGRTQDQLAASDDLDKGHSNHLTTLNKLIAGQQTPSGADKNALDAEAKFLVYRFTVAPTPVKPNVLVEAQTTFVNFVNRVEGPNDRKNNRGFVKSFSPVLMKRFEDVFEKDFMTYRRAIINLAPMLPQAAKFKDEAIGNYLVNILTDHEGNKASKLKNKHDVIKFYAARSMREFFPVTVVPDPENVTAAAAKRMAREVGYVDSLVRFIDRPARSKLSVPEQGAVRFLRREALESLAQARAPAIVADKKRIEGAVAPTLLRVLSPQSGLDPAPNLHERLEAAIGICQMHYANLPEYEPEIGLYLVGRFLQDFAIAYNKDLVGVLDATKSRAPELHWRNHYKRLEIALNDPKSGMVKNAKGHKAEKLAARLAADALILLGPMKGPQLAPVNQAQLTEFRKVVNAMRPATPHPFKNAKNIVIEIDAPKEPE